MIELLFILSAIGVIIYFTYEHIYFLFHFAKKFFRGEKPDEIKDAGFTFFTLFLCFLAGVFTVYLIFTGQLE
tara:strand:+ start:4300 stop:4515 length:216 start_codon:yes stop_codon:yes gene_type:complete